jgi:multidrug efflux pump subunit AcrB
MRIQLDPEKLAAMGLSLEEVRAVLTNITTDSPKGIIDGATRTFTVYDNDQLLNAQPWNDAIITYRNGAPVRVRDIGRALTARKTTRSRAGPVASLPSSSRY